jgi:hypothetical protein
MRSGAVFYVYCLFRPDGRPCYVGKGKGDRIKRHERAGRLHRNPHLAAIIKKAGGTLPQVILHDGLSEDVAFAYEITLIAAIGREVHGGPLVNQSDGGEGPAGMRHSDATKAKISAKSKGNKYATGGSKDPAVRAAASKAISVATTRMWTDPVKKAEILAARAVTNAKPETQAARSASGSRHWAIPGEKEKGGERARQSWAAMPDDKRADLSARRKVLANIQWEDQGRRDSIAAKAVKRNADPEFKSQVAARTKAFWARLTPEERERHLEKLRRGQQRRQAAARASRGLV